IVASVNTNLFQAAGRCEGGDCIDDRAVSRKGQSRGYPHHVRLRDAAIKEPCRAVFAEAIEEAIANIAGKQDDSLVLPSKADQFVCKRVSHPINPNSARAAATSAAV